jgi:hypothetical protein
VKANTASREELSTFTDAAVCRSRLSAQVSITRGPVDAATGASINDFMGIITNVIVKDQTAFQGYADKLRDDTESFNKAFIPYEKALADQSNMDALCGTGTSTTSSSSP